MTAGDREAGSARLGELIASDAAPVPRPSGRAVKRDRCGRRWLLDELDRTAGAIRARHLAALRAAGVAGREIIAADMGGRLGVMKIATAGDLYEPDEGGREAVILPVYYADPWPFDAVAFYLDEPGRSWHRTGIAWLLGMRAIDRYRFGCGWTDAPDPAPVVVHQNPLDWLRSGGDGIAIVDWQIAPIHIREIGLATDDPGFARTLARRLTEPVIKPHIFVRRAAA